MSSKKKPLLSSCQTCSAVILAKDQARHAEFCGKSVEESEIALIKNGVLRGFNTALDRAESFLPPDALGWEKEHSVLMNPETMDHLDVLPRSPLRVRVKAGGSDSGDSSFIAVIWPCKEVALLKVHVFSSRVPRERMVIVEKCTNIRKVKKATVKIDTKMRVRPSTKDFVEMYLSNAYLQVDTPINIKYLGQDFSVIAEKSMEDRLASMSFEETPQSQLVLSLEPGCSVRVTEGDDEKSKGVGKREKPDLRDVGGAFSAKQILEDYIICPTGRNEQACSVLVFGCPGSGKTYLLKKLALMLGSDCVTASSCDDLAQLGDIVTSSSDDDITSKRSGNVYVVDINEMDKENAKAGKVLAELLEKEENTVILSVRSADSLDLGYRVRFPVEAEITVPTQDERIDILKRIASDYGLEEGHELEIAKLTHGFTAGDLCSMLRAAKFARGATAMERIEAVRKRMRPTGIRQFILEVPSVKWNDIGGNEELKLEIQQAVIWPQRHPEAFERFGIDPPAGILLYGPPGCSKTLIARALANEAKMNFLAVKGPELFSKWVGDSEKAIRELFSRARQVAPTIVFFDEIDAVGSSRGSEKSSGVSDRVLAQLLTELDGLEKTARVILLAATNRPDQLDSALLRPGRLDRAIYVGLPCDVTRREILNMKTKKMKLAEDTSVQMLVDKTEGYSGAEIVAVCRTAAMFAMRENIDAQVVEWKHFEAALSAVVARTEAYLLDIYADFKAGRTSNA